MRTAGGFRPPPTKFFSDHFTYQHLFSYLPTLLRIQNNLTPTTFPSLPLIDWPPGICFQDLKLGGRTGEYTQPKRQVMAADAKLASPPTMVSRFQGFLFPSPSSLFFFLSRKIFEFWTFLDAFSEHFLTVFCVIYQITRYIIILFFVNTKITLGLRLGQSLLQGMGFLWKGCPLPLGRKIFEFWTFLDAFSFLPLLNFSFFSPAAIFPPPPFTNILQYYASVSTTIYHKIINLI